MKITDKQYVLFALIVICFVILSNAVVYRNIIDVVYLVVLFVFAIRMHYIGKKNKIM